jgi:hypothetical protein
MSEYSRFIGLIAMRRPMALCYAICIGAGRNALLGETPYRAKRREGRNDSAAAPKSLAAALEAREALE